MPKLTTLMASARMSSTVSPELQAKRQALARDQAGDGDGRNGQADRGAGRAQRDIEATLQFVVERCPDGRHRLRHQHQHGDEEADDGVGLGDVDRLQPVLDAPGDLLGQKHDACQADQQQNAR